MAIEISPDGTRGARFPSGPVFRAFVGLNTALYRLLRGGGMQKSMLLLTTVGSISSKQRTVPVAWFPDGEGAWLIVASAGGSRRHPAWYRNLARNPDRVWIQVGAHRLKVRPELLQGPEREERWQRIVARAANFGGYQKKTDRELPVIRLTPNGGPETAPAPDAH